MPHPLDSFFAPDSIALIGASRDLEKIPGRLLSMLRKNEFPGKIYPINPNYRRYRRAEMLSRRSPMSAQPIDLAIVIIPARAVLGALEECAAVGVKNAVIISSGFAEEGGDSAAMQDAIVALAKRTGMRISGPNAEGFLSEVQKVAATFSPTVDVKPGHVAAGRDHSADRHRRAIRRHRLCHQASRQGARRCDQLLRQRRQRIRSRRRRIPRLHGAGCLHRRDPAVHRGHPRRRQVSRRRAARGGNRKARHRDQGRPLRRRRARRGLAHRQHGRLVRRL